MSQDILIRAHQRVYGTHITRSSPDAEPKCAFSEGETQEAWRRLIASFIITNDSSATVGNGKRRSNRSKHERFVVEGYGPVCAMYCQKAYRGHNYTWNTMLAKAQAGTLLVEEDSNVLGLRGAMRLIDNARDNQRKFECISWWMNWLCLEDQMPNEPVIVYRGVVWSAAYDEEYVPSMAWWGSGETLSRECWMFLRNDALRMLSVEFYGDLALCDEGDSCLTVEMREEKRRTGGHGVSVCMLSLCKHASHSNFASCTKCDRAKFRWTEYRTNAKHNGAGDLKVAEDIKREIFQHVDEVKKERHVGQEMHQVCVGKGGLFQYDNKCGSHFLHLPLPAGGRFSSQIAGRYQYRFGLQGNLIPNGLLRFSLVPLA